MFNNILQKPFCLWDNVENIESQSDDNMAYAHCMLDTKGYNTVSEYVILTAFPLHQWLHKHALMLCHMYTVYLV